MFIELTEVLRCPNDHAESYLVAAPIAMDGRRIVRGVVGCPECHAEFPIVDGVGYFGAAGARDGATAPPPASDYDATALAAFLSLDGPGGYAVLVGATARFGPGIVDAVPGVHFVGVNPPAGVAPSPALSLLESPRVLPFKSATVRAVALGSDHTGAPWLREAVRILLTGLRLVVEDERASPEDVSELARGAGLLVAEKRPG